MMYISPDFASLHPGYGAFYLVVIGLILSYALLRGKGLKQWRGMSGLWLG